MKPITRRILIATLALMLALLPISAALAKGPPSKVIITGPTINGELEITDGKILEALSFYQFNDLNRIISQSLDFTPDVELGEGYHITRLIMENGKSGYRVWDSLTYYPDPAGEAGYIFFDGLDPSIGSTQGQGLWFRATPTGDAAMARVMEIAASQPVTPPPTTPPTVNPMLIVGVVALGSLLLVLSVAMQRDRQAAAI